MPSLSLPLATGMATVVVVVMVVVMVMALTGGCLVLGTAQARLVVAPKLKLWHRPRLYRHTCYMR